MAEATPRYSAGDAVRVRTAYPLGHCRTPYYVRGRRGTVERCCGAFANPEELAYGRDGLPAVPLYRVRFLLASLWATPTTHRDDSLEVEIYEHWLEPDDGP